ncbi:lipopolysaccharide biosynthesis protein [soil metagenome]
MALGRAAFRNSLYMVVGNGSQLIASLGVFLYLARLLTPADFGAMGIAAALVDLLTVFGRFGQVEALLQKGADDQQVRSTSFWLLVMIGVLLFGFIAALAQPFALVTGTYAIGPVLLLLAAVPLIQNLGQVNEAIIRQDMRYGGIAIRNVAATVISAAAAVALASVGYGIYALAAQKLVFTIVYTGAIWIARPWVPSFTYARFEAGRLFRTGFDVTISNTLQMANGRIVDLNIGFFLGTVALGITRVAWRLYDFSLQLVIAPLSSVSYSLFTRVRHDGPALRQTYLQYIELILLMAAPLFIGLSIVSRDMIVFLAGAKWESSALILSMLSLTVLASCISLLFSPVMIAKEQTHIIRRQAIWQTVANLVLTAIAAQYSVIAVVVAYMARMYAFALYNFWLMNRAVDVSFKLVVTRLAPILLATGGLAAAGLGTASFLRDASELLRIVSVAGVGLAAYIAVLILGDILGLWRGLIGRLSAMVTTVLRTRKPA